MPLNIQDKEKFPSEEEITPQPILHKPKEDRTIVRYILFTLFILIVLISVIFLLYIFVYKGRIETTSRDESTPGTISGTVVEQPIQIIPHIGELPKIQEPVKPVPSGKYTVYISSYKVRQPADEEVARWNEAGFQASVIEANNHFRVSLGKYTALPDAEQTAHELEEAFENGYWIGKFQQY